MYNFVKKFNKCGNYLFYGMPFIMCIRDDALSKKSLHLIIWCTTAQHILYVHEFYRLHVWSTPSSSMRTPTPCSWPGRRSWCVGMTWRLASPSANTLWSFSSTSVPGSTRTNWSTQKRRSLVHSSSYPLVRMCWWWFLCRLQSIAAHRDHFVRRLSVLYSHFLGSHTFLVVTHSYVSQATHAFLGLLPLCYVTSDGLFDSLLIHP